MKLTRSLCISTLAGLGLFLLAGCSTPTKVDSGPIKAQTFCFMSRTQAEDPSFADKRAPIHAMIQQSITDNLAARGVKRVAENGDVIVAYLVIVGDNATTEAINTYFGYGRNADVLHDKAHEAYTDSKVPYYFQAGTLLVDIIDAKTYKLLWRSHVTRPLLQNPTEQVRAEHIQEAVNSLLKNLRISP